MSTTTNHVQTDALMFILEEHGHRLGISSYRPAPLYLITDMSIDNSLYTRLPDKRRFGLSPVDDRSRSRIHRANFLSDPIDLRSVLGNSRYGSSARLIAIANITHLSPAQVEAYATKCYDLGIDYAVVIADSQAFIQADQDMSLMQSQLRILDQFTAPKGPSDQGDILVHVLAFRKHSIAEENDPDVRIVCLGNPTRRARLRRYQVPKSVRTTSYEVDENDPDTRIIKLPRSKRGNGL